MDALKISETKSICSDVKQQLLQLWNAEYPVKIAYTALSEFDTYLANLGSADHFLVTDKNNTVFGWAFSFVREQEKWFAIILSEKIQGKGFGRELLEKLKKKEPQLNGWVIDHDRDKKINGEPYRSPLEFYRKCGFKIMSDQRLELENISAVKIKWEA